MIELNNINSLSVFQLFTFVVGCFEKGIMNILCYRTNAQRQTIKDSYKTLYGKVGFDSVNRPSTDKFDLYFARIW